MRVCVCACVRLCVQGVRGLLVCDSSSSECHMYGWHAGLPEATIAISSSTSNLDSQLNDSYSCKEEHDDAMVDKLALRGQMSNLAP